MLCISEAGLRFFFIYLNMGAISTKCSDSISRGIFLKLSNRLESLLKLMLLLAREA